MDICTRCGAYRKHHASADHKFALFPTDTYTVGDWQLKMRGNEFSVRSIKRGYGRVKRGYRKHARPKLRTAARFTGRAATRGGQWLYRRL